jgi:hypothetical protein
MAEPSGEKATETSSSLPAPRPRFGSKVCRIFGVPPSMPTPLSRYVESTSWSMCRYRMDVPSGLASRLEIPPVSSTIGRLAPVERSSSSIVVGSLLAYTTHLPVMNSGSCSYRAPASAVSRRDVSAIPSYSQRSPASW